MEQSESTPDLPNPAPSPTSLTDRLTNVFITPAEVFEEVKVSPPTPANWAVPLVLAIIASITYVMVVFSQPAVLQQMREAPEKRIQTMVASGKMKQADADRASALIEKIMTPRISKSLESSLPFSPHPRCCS